MVFGMYIRSLMPSNENKALQRFLWIGRGEGVSFLILVFIAMPFKYALDMPLLVKYFGWAHGLLFMAYVAQLVIVAFKMKWDLLEVIFGFVAALLPFGPFVYERRLAKQNATEEGTL